MLVELLTALSLHTVSAIVGTDHICSGNTTEQAGVSGTVYVEAACHLTLTNITGKINVQGINDSLCEGDQKLVVNNETYCTDAKAVTTIINVSGNELEIKSAQAQNSTIQYYHGKGDCQLLSVCTVISMLVCTNYHTCAYVKLHMSIIYEMR